MKKTSIAFSLLMLVTTVGTAWSQSRYAFCFSYHRTANYNTGVFQIPDALVADELGRIQESGEPTASFRKYLVARFGLGSIGRNGLPADAGTTVCSVFSSMSEAVESLRTMDDYARKNYPGGVTRTSWVYAPMKQGTHSGTGTTEAGALYDAEHYPGPFEKPEMDRSGTRRFTAGTIISAAPGRSQAYMAATSPRLPMSAR